METIGKDVRIDVEKLTSVLRRKRTTRPRFRLPLTYEQACGVLRAAYRAEVESRHREFVADEGCMKSVSRLAMALTAERPKFGVMLCGTCGNGKTTLLRAFRTALNWLSDDMRLFDESVGIVLLGAKELAAQSKDWQRFKTICDSPLLGIDDMGREPMEVLEYGNVLSPMTDLLEHRYSEQLFTMVTTNLNSEEIKERYKARIADRFNEMLEVIVFEGGSFRSGRGSVV